MSLFRLGLALLCLLLAPQPLRAGREAPAKGVTGTNLGGLTTVTRGNQIVYHKVGEGDWSINLTNRCPNCCPFCIRDRQEGWNSDASGKLVNLYLKGDPTHAELRAAVREKLADPTGKVGLVKFCGYGEPVLRMPEILKLARLIKRETRATNPDLKLQINTTGWPIYTQYPGRNVMALLKKAGIDVLSVSLNAPDPEHYRKWTRPHIDPTEAFELSKQALREAHEAGLETRATAVDLGHYTKQPELRQAFETLARDLGAVPLVRPFERTPGLAAAPK